jgi:hypothetical protein
MLKALRIHRIRGRKDVGGLAAFDSRAQLRRGAVRLIDDDPGLLREALRDFRDRAA